MIIGSKKNLAAIITDRNNPHYGKIGKIKKFQLDGGIVIKFSDNKEINFDYDNGSKIVKLFYRRYNKKGIKFDEKEYGPRKLAQMYRELGGTISEFIDEYHLVFGERPEKIG